MSAAPEVSILMANYNGARHLAEAIRSAQTQTLADWELILVDDASTDASLAEAAALAAGDPRIRVLAQGLNQGPAAARNRGLQAARGRWIAVVDSDDVMLPRRLERLLARARAEGLSIVADNQWICSAELQPERPFVARDVAAGLERVDLAGFVDSSRLYARRPDLGFVKPLIDAALIARAGARYDESLRIGEDFHFLVRLLASGAVLGLEPEPLYLYRKHPGSISHRMSEPVLAAMIAASQEALAVVRHDPAAVRAMGRRIAGLRSWAAYERVMHSAKAGRWGAAAAEALRHPHAWALISRPARSRLRKLLRRPAGAPAAAFDAPAEGPA